VYRNPAEFAEGALSKIHDSRNSLLCTGNGNLRVSLQPSGLKPALHPSRQFIPLYRSNHPGRRVCERARECLAKAPSRTFPPASASCRGKRCHLCPQSGMDGRTQPSLRSLRKLGCVAQRRRPGGDAWNLKGTSPSSQSQFAHRAGLPGQQSTLKHVSIKWVHCRSKARQFGSE